MIINLMGDRFTDNIPFEIKAQYSFVVINHLHKGEMFGEHSAIDGARNPYSIEVESDSAVVVRIER